MAEIVAARQIERGAEGARTGAAHARDNPSVTAAGLAAGLLSSWWRGWVAWASSAREGGLR